MKIFDWLKKNLAIIGFFVALFVMFICFISGCNYHKNRHPCNIQSNTITIIDSSTNKIIDSLQCIIDSLMSLPIEERIKWLPRDTFFTPIDTFFKDVDTVAILKNHYSVFRYHWYKLDTGKLELDLYTTVTRNMPIKYELDYKILQPQTIINNTQDNSIHFKKYIYTGIDFPFNIEYASIDVLIATERLYIGAGYIPLQKGVSVKGGIRLFKFE